MHLYYIICYNTEKLKEYFEVYGEVHDSVVMKDPVSKRSRGFGFITFTDINSVDSVLTAFATSSTSSAIINENIGSLNHSSNIDGRRVEIKRAVPRVGDIHTNSNTNSSNNTIYNSTRSLKKEKDRDKADKEGPREGHR